MIAYDTKKINVRKDADRLQVVKNLNYLAYFDNSRNVFTNRSFLRF